MPSTFAEGACALSIGQTYSGRQARSLRKPYLQDQATELLPKTEAWSEQCPNPPVPTRGRDGFTGMWSMSSHGAHAQRVPNFVCLLSRFNHVQISATPWTVSGQVPLSMHSLGKNYGSWRMMALLQGIFPSQGSNSQLLCLLHCRQILFTAEPWGKPYVPYPFTWDVSNIFL